VNHGSGHQENIQYRATDCCTRAVMKAPL